ncbi:cupin domain-containing protein [Novosphingobium sp. M1R2S20]|uniref:Cupin domain-containing protein n=1 Tax=Novosphingobium rhizovicinum TaxID=3228928 RepID=A0ABV3RBE7_9SPHN
MSNTFGSEEHKISFRIFKRHDGRPCDLMTFDGPTSGEVPSADTAEAESGEKAQIDPGNDLQVLFDMPGLSLVHVWFKSGYPLPRHTHNVDCLYYITGGSIRMGQELLGPGDGFFVGANVPYTYTPGEEGVALLEIRPSNSFDIKVPGDMAMLRAKSAKIMLDRQEAWAGETSPPDNG